MKPISEVRVLDMGQITAGPMASWLLDPLVSEVIKIERPDGGESGRPDPSADSDEMSYAFQSGNYNKKSLGVNIDSEQGQEIVKSLANEADVLIENFRPQTLTELGLGPEELRNENNSLIYCSISGFGHDSAETNQRAYDSTIQAMSGLMNLTGFKGDGPVKLGPSVMDVLPGFVSATAIITALYERKSTGEGQHIDISMQDCAAWMLQSRLPFPNEPTNHGPSRSPEALAGVFETETDWVTISVQDEESCERLKTNIQNTDPAIDWGNSDDAVENVVAEWAAQRPTQEVIKTCSQSGVKASKVQSIEDVAESTHLEQRGAFDQVNYGGESMRLPVSPYTSAKQSASETESREAPEVGEHTDQILSDILGYDRSTLEQLRSENVIN